MALQVILNILTQAELSVVRELASRATWIDGHNTARRCTVKHNEQVDVRSSEGHAVAQIVVDALARRIPEPVALTTPMLNRYRVGMEYGSHIDAEVMDGVRPDVAMTLFLSDPADYGGGELLIAGSPPVKLAAGEAIVYACDRVHAVTPVTRGERLAVVCWIQNSPRIGIRPP